MRPWQIVLASLMIIIPILLSGLYSSKIHKIHRLQLYNSEGWIFRIVSGNTFSTIFWIFVAVFEGALIFGQLTIQELGFNLKALFIYLGAFCIGKIFVEEVIGKTYKDFYKPIKVIFLASIIGAVFSSLVFAYFEPLQLYEAGKFTPITDTYNHILDKYNPASSNSLALFQKCVALKDSLPVYFASRYDNQYAYFILNFVTQFPFFFSLGPFLGFAFIKWSELKRIWCPPVETVLPPQTSTIFWSAFLGVIGILGYATLIVSNETTLNQISPVVDNTFQSITSTADRVIVEVDSDGRFLFPGTVESYNAFAIKTASAQIKYFVEEEIRLVNNVYDSLENGVDKYLDWYYSLAAEYARLGKALMGGEELENYMDKNFQEFLYSPRTQAYLEELANLKKKIADGGVLPSYIEFIKDKIVEPNPSDIVEKIPAPPIVTYPEVLKKLDPTDGLFNTRMATATGVGLAGALGVKALSKKIAGKVAAKGIFKMGAKILAKVAVKTTVSAAGGAAGGAATGAIIGSIIPGLGTGVGAVIGGLVGGVITWVATDEVFLKAEELLDRASYRQEILAAINEERRAQISRLQTFLNQMEQNTNGS